MDDSLSWPLRSQAHRQKHGDWHGPRHGRGPKHTHSHTHTHTHTHTHRSSPGTALVRSPRTGPAGGGGA